MNLIQIGLGPNQIIDFKRYYSYGILINLVPVYMFYPIRTAKTIQQSNIGTSSSTFLGKVFVERVKSEGIRGLFKGVGIYAVGSISGRLIHFSTYDALRERVHRNSLPPGLKWLEGHSPTTTNAFLGTLSALTTSTFMVPFDVISQHLQVSKGSSSSFINPSSSGGNNNNNNIGSNNMKIPKRTISTTNSFFQPSLTAPHDISQQLTNYNHNNNRSIFSLKNYINYLKPKELPLHRFLYRGWVATILSTISFYPTYFFVYTYTLERLYESKDRLPTFLSNSHFFCSVTAGAAAGFAGTITSNPFDIVKTRIQIARKNNINSEISSNNSNSNNNKVTGRGEQLKNELKFFEVTKNIIKSQGFKGLWVGMIARMWIIVPLGSLNFWVFEKVRDWSIVNVNTC